MANTYYFANDGTFGAAIDGVIVDTANWTDQDWEIVTDAADDVRHHLALILTEYRGGQVTQMVPIQGAVTDPDIVQDCIDLLEPTYRSVPA